MANLLAEVQKELGLSADTDRYTVGFSTKRANLADRGRQDARDLSHRGSR
jgi:hypothetical protein